MTENNNAAEYSRWTTGQTVIYLQWGITKILTIKIWNIKISVLYLYKQKKTTMRFIQLTSRDNKKIYINVETIGHIYGEKETGQYGGEVKDRVITYVGCLTHNNGGFKVLESVSEVLTLIYDDKLGI